MSKFVKNEKALKAVMAGAVAFTPVIAVGVNAEKVDAASIDTIAESLATNYDSLTTTEKEVLKIVLNNVSEHLDEFLHDTSNTELKADLRNLMAIPTYDGVEDLKTQLINRYEAFVASSQEYLDVEETPQQLADYIYSVNLQLVDALEDNDVSTGNLSGFLSQLEGILKNGAPESLKDYFRVPADPVGIVAEIQNEVDDYLDGDGGGPVIVVPGPSNPTPTPENPVVDDKKGQVAATADAVVSNPQSVIDAIKKAEQISTLAVAVKAGEAQIAIPFTIVAALEGKNANATVAVSAEHATYHMPVAEIDAAAVARQLGVATSELKLVVSMEKVANPLASQSTYKVLADAVDFKASLQAPGGKSVELTVFAKPVQRTILSTQTALDPVTTVGVMVGANGAITAVPTYVTEDKKNADLYRAGNSTYTLIENFKTFNDVNNGKNWAEDYIERLASKMVVNGTTATTFEPDRSISRGEFAALLSRGLGLTAQNKTVKFSDVSANQAFNKNGEIASVVEAGIVQGDKNGKFRPYDTITRDEAAIMISRAMDFIDSEYVKLEPGKKVSHFEDYRYIGGTARPHVEKVYQAGYLGGYSNGTFGPANETERAQMAKILYNFLQSIHFIN